MTKQLSNQYQSIQTWLEQTLLSDLLDWFDGGSVGDVANPFGVLTNSVTIVERDKLFLELLYAELETQSRSDHVTADNIFCEVAE